MRADRAAARGRPEHELNEDSRESQPSTRELLGIVVAFLASYLLAALWASELTVVGGASPWFPGAGIALALLVLAGPRFAPLLLVAELLSAQYVFAVPFSPVQDLISALALTLWLTLAATAIRRLIGSRPQFSDFAELRIFAAIGVIAMPVLAGLSGYAMLAWAGVGGWDEFVAGWRTYAVGDAVGVAAVTPVLLALAASPLHPALGRIPALGPVGVAQAIALVGAPFLPVLLDGERPVLFALALIPVAWIALSRSLPTAAFGVLVAIIATTLAARTELGASEELVDVQLFLLAVALLGLSIAVMMRILRHSQASLALRADQDPLTGLTNRRPFIEEIERRLGAGEQAAVLFIDLDRFKLVNETLGHEVGDRLLNAIAGRLARTDDSQEATFARFGGDEFTAVTGGGEGGLWAHAERLGQRVLESFADPLSVDGKQFSIDVSVGISVARPGDRPETVVGQADLAMRSSKQRGGSCISHFDETMSARADRRLAIERGLREALDADRLTLGYQPIVPLASAGPGGIEALLRWRTVAGEEISPGEFIPIAEETGLIFRIGRWVVAEACRAASRWDGSTADAPTIWVNVSAAELAAPDFVDFVIATLGDSDLEGHGRLGIELTESVLMNDSEPALKRLGRLRDAGVKLALDDFGTGYSSLGYLGRLPIDTIKIDRSFIAGLSARGEADPVPAMITDLAHRLGLDVVGEGVETAQQRQVLRQLGCDFAQGWLFGRPGSIEAAFGVLRAASR